jgi:ankyrin repeat protein
LHAAAIGNCSAEIRLLLNKGKADPNTTDLALRTPLHYAAERGLLSACEDLVRGGASVDTVDRCGLTPPQVAENAGFADVSAAMLSTTALTVLVEDDDAESFV